MCQEAACLQEIQIQHSAELIGHLAAALQGVQFGTVFVKGLKIIKNQALSVSHRNYSGIAQISDLGRQDLIWWVNLQSAFNPVKANLPSITVSTDASKTGLGRGNVMKSLQEALGQKLSQSCT